MGGPDVVDGLPQDLLATENLPSPPVVAVEVLRITRDEHATIGDLAQVLSQDPALSAKILKLANSSMFRRGDPVTSLDKATMRLGMKTVTLMALSFSLASNLPRKGENRGFDYFRYWSHSLTMAVAGRALARMVRSPYGDEAFLCGLLGRLGQLILAEHLDTTYARVIERAEGELPSADLEREAFGYDFHRVGGALLSTWQLPELIWQTVAWWGEPERTPAQLGDAVGALAWIVQLAGRTAVVICEGKGTALRDLYALGQDCFGISQDELDAFVVSLEEDVSEMAAMLNVDVDRSSYQGIVDRARMEMVQISLGTAADLQETASRAIDLEQKNRELETLATTDKLTSIPNRARFDQMLERVVHARLTGESPNALGILMIDVDHFKKFNDTHGHQVGDEALKLVAGALAEMTRDTDIAARYGGEEFVVIISNTNLDDLTRVAERVRERIERASLLQQGQSLSVTVSVGGASVRRVNGSGDGKALLALADTCLYEAKRAGRNRCVCREVESTDTVAR